MASALSISLPPEAAYTSEPVFRLSVDQYHELIRAGKLTDEDPVELLEGILVHGVRDKTPYAVTVKNLSRREISQCVPAGYFYDSEQPITLPDGEPEPDGAVVRGRIEDYRQAHPGPEDVALVIEVADSSLERDRGIKLRSYARASIPAYWIINLIDRQVEVYTDPDSAAHEPVYRRREIFKSGDALSAMVGDHKIRPVSVDDILPAA